MGIGVALYKGLIRAGELFQPVLLLLIRVAAGAGFIMTGIGKLQDIPRVAAYLGTLGFTWPHVDAYFIGIAELVAGLMLLIGFGGRFAGLLMMVNMFVAYFMAHQPAVVALLHGAVSTFIAQSAFPFLMASSLIFAFGPGAFSIDAVLKRRRFQKDTAE